MVLATEEAVGAPIAMTTTGEGEKEASTGEGGLHGRWASAFHGDA